MALSAIRTFLNEPKYYVPTIGTFALISGLCLGLGHNGESCISGCAFGGAAVLVIFIKYMKKRAEKEVARPNVQNVDGFSGVDGDDVRVSDSERNKGGIIWAVATIQQMRDYHSANARIFAVNSQKQEVELTEDELRMNPFRYMETTGNSIVYEYKPSSNSTWMNLYLQKYEKEENKNDELKVEFEVTDPITNEKIKANDKRVCNRQICDLLNENYQIRAYHRIKKKFMGLF